MKILRRKREISKIKIKSSEQPFLLLIHHSVISVALNENKK